MVVANWRDGAHPDAGGAEVYAERLAGELVEHGYRVTFVSAAHDPRRPVGTGGHRAPAAEPTAVEHLRGGGRWSVYPWVAAWLLRHRGDIDVVVDCQNGIPFFAPLWVRRRTAVVCVVHHVHTEQFGLHFPAPVAAVGRWLEGPATRWVYGRRVAVAVSPSTARGLRDRLQWRGPIHVVPNGAPDVAPGPQSGTGSEVGSTTPTVVSVARLVVHKRVQLLVAAAAGLARRRPDVRVEIIGAGPELARLEPMVADLGLADVVTLAGRRSDDEVRASLDRSWLAVATTRGEGWGLSVLEAAARGRPTLAFDVDGLRDAVRTGRTGWLIPDGAPLDEAIDDALTELADPTIRANLATECRRWAAEFTWPGSGRRLASVICAATAAAARSGPERRRVVDDATLVELDRSGAPPSRWQLRVTDRFGVWESRPWLLLTGCTTAEVRPVLARSGVAVEAVVAMRPATPEDLLRAVPLRSVVGQR